MGTTTVYQTKQKHRNLSWYWWKLFRLQFQTKNKNEKKPRVKCSSSIPLHLFHKQTTSLSFSLTHSLTFSWFPNESFVVKKLPQLDSQITFPTIYLFNSHQMRKTFPKPQLI